MTARIPEQDEARLPVGDEPADSRQIRRRLTFGVAGDLADLPASLSPWQRAFEAWRSAGLRWGHGLPPRERVTAPDGAASRDAIRADDTRPRPRPAKPKSATSTPAAPAKAKPAEAKPPAAKPPARKAAKAGRVTEEYAKPVAGAKAQAAGEKPRKTAAETEWTRGLRPGIAGAAGLVLAAAGAIFVLGQVDDGKDTPRVPRPVAADRMFTTDPAARTDGLVQDLAAIASAGGTIVAVGTEGDVAGGRERAGILMSADAGRSWRTARVRGADGDEPPLGDRPRLAAGGSGSWVVLGDGAAGGTVAWTSDDAATWTRRPLGGAFRPDDRVSALTRTPYGYVAVGAAGDRAVVWSSADGRAWQRVDGLQAPGITGLDRVAATGNVLVTHGTYARKVTTKKRKKKVTRTVRGDGLWRSADGGRTWTAVNVPQAQGSYGPTRGLVAGPGGFATVRDGSRTTGRRKHRATARFGVLFTSADGQAWRAAGQVGAPGFAGVERFGGTPSGLAVLVRGTDGARTVLRSADGRTWQPGGTVRGPEVSGMTVAAGGAVALSGHQDDDAYLSGVNLAAVPGAVHPERTIRSVAAGPGRVVAVGSTNGGTAVWSARDGRAWVRGRFPGSGGWLSGVAVGSQGWLAVGRTSGASPGPLALVSADGATWRGVPFPSGPPPSAAAAGTAGYVAVGEGAAWRSSDLKGWKRAGLDGAPADVAATAQGYVAVGGRDKAPAIWTSPDGLKWTPAKLPSGTTTGTATGPLSEVAARGGTIVAIGEGSVPLVSADGGTTWTPRALGAASTSGVSTTAVTTTSKGFVVAGTLGGRDAAVWASPDGTAWHRVAAPGLDGPGDQRLTTMTAMGAELLAVGTSTDHRAVTSLLWRVAAP